MCAAIIKNLSHESEIKNRTDRVGSIGHSVRNEWFYGIYFSPLYLSSFWFKLAEADLFYTFAYRYFLSIHILFPHPNHVERFFSWRYLLCLFVTIQHTPGKVFFTNVRPFVLATISQVGCSLTKYWVELKIRSFNISDKSKCANFFRPFSCDFTYTFVKIGLFPRQQTTWNLKWIRVYDIKYARVLRTKLMPIPNTIELQYDENREDLQKKIFLNESRI